MKLVKREKSVIRGVVFFGYFVWVPWKRVRFKTVLRLFQGKEDFNQNV